MALRTLLLVEDNPEDVELARMAFERAELGIRLDHAKDGVEALDYLMGMSEGRPTRALPITVLLDLKLPRVGGLEVLKRVRADPRTKFLPVVILTSSSHPADVTSSYRLGCNSYVRKPVDFPRFLDVVRQLGIYWLTLNESPEELR